MHEAIVYHIIHANGKWTVTKDGHSEPLADFINRADAIEFARAEARELGMGIVRIHGEDNTVEQELSFVELF